MCPHHLWGSLASLIWLGSPFSPEREIWRMCAQDLPGLARLHLFPAGFPSLMVLRQGQASWLACLNSHTSCKCKVKVHIRGCALSVSSWYMEEKEHFLCAMPGSQREADRRLLRNRQTMSYCQHLEVERPGLGTRRGQQRKLILYIVICCIIVYIYIIMIFPFFFMTLNPQTHKYKGVSVICCASFWLVGNNMSPCVSRVHSLAFIHLSTHLSTDIFPSASSESGSGH